MKSFFCPKCGEDKPIKYRAKIAADRYYCCKQCKAKIVSKTSNQRETLKMILALNKDNTS